MRIPVQRPEPGLISGHETPLPLYGEHIVAASLGNIVVHPGVTPFYGERSLSNSTGILVSNTDVLNASTQYNVPGFALRKGLRVMTLVDNKVMAFRNIVD